MSIVSEPERPATQTPPRLSSPAQTFSYRAISRAAVLSLMLGGSSIVALFDWSLAVVPATAILAGTLALVAIRRQPEELTGDGLALTGVVLATVFWAGGWSWLGYEYLTEVPADCVRLTFDELQPSADAPQAAPAITHELNGRRVFIKGYMYPGRNSTGIREFVLCYSKDECCFGGSPKLTHMVHVVLPPPLSTTFSSDIRKVVGTFRLGTGASVDGLPGAIYHLEAEDVR